MKARIKFQKYGAMKFIGHLDIMRYFQKLFRRANIDNEYTKGFSPHQIMSFAAPLGVGLTSDAEYLDVQLLSCDAPDVMVERINAILTEGFRIVDFHPLLEAELNTKVVTAMSLVALADYLVSLKDGYTINDTIITQSDFAEAFRKFMKNPEIVIGKKTKTSEKEVNIKPMISLAAFDQDEYEMKLQECLRYPYVKNKPESKADVYENGIQLYLQIDTGSSANLKPELVMEAFYEELGLAFEKSAWQVHRLEVYTKDPVTGKLAALNQVDR
ncbi:MAG TPA: TIGR03936 family radical SAM-associated protein [Mobilitalea sp.]|nr:TIGR03936 family radical SAM-associated protein [Mobilitalea sp.]